MQEQVESLIYAFMQDKILSNSFNYDEMSKDPFIQSQISHTIQSIFDRENRHLEILV